MDRVRTVTGLIVGVVLILSACAHSLLGWPQIRGGLEQAQVSADLIGALRAAWQFGGAAMFALGIVVLSQFRERLRGRDASSAVVLPIALVYVLYGVWALAVSNMELFYLVFLVPGLALAWACWPVQRKRTTPNTRTVEAYMDGFRTTDRPTILSCLTDDVEWVLPGAFQVHGKDEFAKHIVDEGFVDRPVISVHRLLEAGDVVVAEGSVRAPKTDGSSLDLVFCDVFDMQRGKIRRLISYLMETK